VRVAAEGGEALDEVVDLVVGEGEAEGLVGFDEGGAALGEHGDGGEGLRRRVAEKYVEGREVGEHDLRHAVVEARGERGALGGGRRGAAEVDPVGDGALDAFNFFEAADARDVGGFRGPGRDGARSGRDDLEEALGLVGFAVGTVGQQLFQNGALFGGELGGELGDMDERGGDVLDGEAGGLEVLDELLRAEVGEGGSAAEDKHVRRRENEPPLRSNSRLFGSTASGPCQEYVFGKRRRGGVAVRKNEKGRSIGDRPW